MDTRDDTWRVRPAERLAGVVLTTGWAGLATGVSIGGNSAAIVLWLMVPLIALGVWRWAFVPYIALDPVGVVVQNRIGKVTVPYSQIRDVRTGYSGLTLKLDNGSSVTAWAVQKSNWARWRKLRTRSDEVADAIRMHLDQGGRARP